MGSSHSTTEQVNQAVMNQESKSSCTCSANASNSIGDISMLCGDCCCTGTYEFDQTAQATCDCEMKSAIEALSSLADQMSAETKASFSFATATSDSKQINSQTMNQTLSDKCNSASSATNYIKSIQIKELGDCCHASQAALDAMAKSRKVWKQTASAQGKCLMAIAAKMAGKQDNKEDNTTTSTDPFNYLAQTMGDTLGNMFGDLTQYMVPIAMIIGLVVVIVFVVPALSKGGGDNSDDDTRAEAAIYRGALRCEGLARVEVGSHPLSVVDGRIRFRDHSSRRIGLDTSARCRSARVHR